MSEKIYHIYLDNKCLYHSLNEEEFKLTWKMISEFLSITDEEKLEGLSYEEVAMSKEVMLNSSH